MGDDIVTRLRRLVWLAAMRHDTAELVPAAIEAADEIEQLRGKIRELETNNNTKEQEQ